MGGRDRSQADERTIQLFHNSREETVPDQNNNSEKIGPIQDHKSNL